MRQKKKQKTVKTEKYFMTILLLASLILTAPSVSILAETVESVSSNSAEAADIKEAENAAGTADGNTVSMDGIPSESVSINEIPPNPVHHCTKKDDGSDTTTWGYIQFGSYPSSMVTDKNLKSAIDAAIEAEDKRSRGEGIDVWVNGVQYRRIDRSDCATFGFFDNLTEEMYLYYKWEPIKWKVLQVGENDLFILADKAIDVLNYNKAYGEIIWRDCIIRSWLNNDFYQKAFNEEEQRAIVQQEITDNFKAGAVTTDKIYLLSIDDVTNETYGFCPDGDVHSGTRRIKASDYAHVRGAWGRKGFDYDWSWCYCWLRSPTRNTNTGAAILDDGFIETYYYDPGYCHNGIVPAMHIDLSSDNWDITEGGDGDNTDDENKGDGSEDNKNGGNSTDLSKVRVSSISLGGISKKIAAGKKISLSAEIMPKNAENKAVTWVSSNPKYAAVDEYGVVKTNKAGAGKTVTITAAAKDGSGVQAQYQIKIMKHAVKKVKITASSKKVKAGGKLKLKATVVTTGKNANKKLKWTSSNESYATVSSGGVVKASKAGKGKTVTITAVATDGSGKKAKVKIKIN